MREFVRAGHPVLVFSALVLTACAAPRPVTAPAPQPAAAPPAPATSTPAPIPSPAPPTPRVTYRTSPAAWHLLDPATDGVAGVGARRALTELLGNAPPKRVITVAVIDGGVDTAHTALTGTIVLNSRETPANGRDDDGNGYIDDARGWNFIGGANGSIDDAQLELTRLVSACRANGGKSAVDKPCAELDAEYTKARSEASAEWDGLRPVLTEYDSLLSVVAKDAGVAKTAITARTLSKLSPRTPAARLALQRMQGYAGNGLTPDIARVVRHQVEGRLKVGYSLTFDGRRIVGDTPAMGRSYGNADITGPDASHGTAVASVIAAVSGDSGFIGIAPGVRILPVRAVPNGDETDKDVANAIRYAVGAGAQIINMSFGKPYSPGKSVVDSAVQFAVSRGVLLVHASGNESANLDQTSTYPSATYEGPAGAKAATWIDVGASGWRSNEQLAAEFSNFGQTTVDLFAPGAQVYAAAPSNEFSREDGTSIAAPVVSGVAALLMSHFPTLSAADVKRILMASVTKFPDLQVQRPGSRGQRVPFASLSISGGVVNAYEAVKMAQRETAKTQ